MIAKTSILSSLLLAGCAFGVASAQTAFAGPAPLSSNPATRIVGLWQSRITVGPCSGGPATSFTALGNFQAGGTLGYTNTMPPPGVSPTFGSWKYVNNAAPRNRRYQARMQFYRFKPDGSFDGVQDIHRTIILSANGQRMDETVLAYVRNVDGSLRVQLCGSGTGERINID